MSFESSRARLAYPLSGTGAGINAAGTAGADAQASSACVTEIAVPARTQPLAQVHAGLALPAHFHITRAEREDCDRQHAAVLARTTDLH